MFGYLKCLGCRVKRYPIFDIFKPSSNYTLLLGCNLPHGAKDQGKASVVELGSIQQAVSSACACFYNGTTC